MRLSRRADLYRRLQNSARAHHRRVDREVVVCLEKALAGQPADVAALLAKVREVRDSVGTVFLIDRDLKQARREGGPR
jgi:hypothetical protein